MDIPAHDAPVTAAWLTAALRHSGALPRGEVAAVQARRDDAFNSAVDFLAVRYAGAPAGLPEQLVLKRNLPAEWAVAAGSREVAFYQLAMAAERTREALPPCMAALDDPAARRSCLLLADLSATHTAPRTRQQCLDGDGVPPPPLLDAALDAVGRFHAAWWQHPRLGEGVLAVSPWCRDAEHYRRHCQRRAREWGAFLAAVGDTIPEELRDFGDSAVHGLPRLWEPYLAPRVAGCRQLTAVHGDCYFSNMLCPRRPGAVRTYLLDYQDVAADFAAGDLVNLLATFWTPQQRHAGDRELGCLRRYHRALLAGGVADYPWEQVLADYRLLLLDWFFVAVWDQTNGSPRDYWWPKLSRLAAACRDWRCLELPAG